MTKRVTFSFLGGVLMLFTGCGGSKQAEKSLVWPDPPDQPRIKYVKTIRSEEDYKSGLGNVLEAIGGKKMVLDFARPFDICADGRGHIFISDGLQGIFSIDENRKEFKLLSCPTCDFSLKEPRGIACDAERIYVGLPSLGQVAVLSHRGEFLYTIGQKGSMPNPLDVVVDTIRNRVYVVDNKIHQVRVFTVKGDSLFTIGKRGMEDGEFNFPQSAAIDPFGNLYVVDAFNFRIEVFDSTGKFQRKFGEQGDVWGSFAMPKGIALDADTNIYILDAQHQHFQIFNNHGELLLFVGRYSTGNDGFINPVSMCIDRGTIYITDQLNRRIQVFQILKSQ